MKKFVKRTLGIIFTLLASLLMMGMLLLFLIRIPGIQNFITHHLVSFVSGKTHTRIAIKKLYVGFPKTVVIEGLFAEDLQHDTLLAFQKLEVDLNMIGILHKKVAVNSLVLTGATAKIGRNTDSVYNFGFFIKAFSPSGKKPVVVKNTIKTDTTGWVVEVNRVTLQNINGSFEDAIGGTSIKGFIGKLDLDMKAIDIKHLSFNGNRLFLSDATVKMVQKKQGAETPDTSITLMPLLALNNLQLHQVSFIFENEVNGQLISIQAGDAFLLPQKIDLTGHIIHVGKVNLRKTSATIAMRKNATDTATVKPVLAKQTSPWQIKADSLKLDTVNFKFDITNVPKAKSGVDYNHLGLTNANIDITGASYTPYKI